MVFHRLAATLARGGLQSVSALKTASGASRFTGSAKKIEQEAAIAAAAVGISPSSSTLTQPAKRSGFTRLANIFSSASRPPAVLATSSIGGAAKTKAQRNRSPSSKRTPHAAQGFFGKDGRFRRRFGFGGSAASGDSGTAGKRPPGQQQAAAPNVIRVETGGGPRHTLIYRIIRDTAIIGLVLVAVIKLVNAYSEAKQYLKRERRRRERLRKAFLKRNRVGNAADNPIDVNFFERQKTVLAATWLPDVVLDAATAGGKGGRATAAALTPMFSSTTMLPEQIAGDSSRSSSALSSSSTSVSESKAAGARAEAKSASLAAQLRQLLAVFRDSQNPNMGAVDLVLHVDGRTAPVHLALTAPSARFLSPDGHVLTIAEPSTRGNAAGSGNSNTETTSKKDTDSAGPEQGHGGPPDTGGGPPDMISRTRDGGGYISPITSSSFSTTSSSSGDTTNTECICDICFQPQTAATLRCRQGDFDVCMNCAKKMARTGYHCVYASLAGTTVDQVAATAIPDKKAGPPGLAATSEEAASEGEETAAASTAVAAAGVSDAGKVPAGGAELQKAPKIPPDTSKGRERKNYDEGNKAKGDIANESASPEPPGSESEIAESLRKRMAALRERINALLSFLSGAASDSHNSILNSFFLLDGDFEFFDDAGGSGFDNLTDEDFIGGGSTQDHGGTSSSSSSTAGSQSDFPSRYNPDDDEESESSSGLGRLFEEQRSLSQPKAFKVQRHVKTRFSDVIGQDIAVEKMREFVDILQYPDRYAQVGSKVPKGGLLLGPPGCGKTLLASAVAGECNLPFISAQASEFVQVYVGMGAKNVQQLFALARKEAEVAGGCIVFIDEIDSIGRDRAKSFTNGDGETGNTLNQLLTEMDGFHSKGENIVVLAATNRASTLDSALMRPGRLDRKLPVQQPNTEERVKLFSHYLQKFAWREADLVGTAGSGAGAVAGAAAGAAAAAAAAADDAVEKSSTPASSTASARISSASSSPSRESAEDKGSSTAEAASSPFEDDAASIPKGSQVTFTLPSVAEGFFRHNMEDLVGIVVDKKRELRVVLQNSSAMQDGNAAADAGGSGGGVEGCDSSASQDGNAVAAAPGGGSGGGVTPAFDSFSMQLQDRYVVQIGKKFYIVDSGDVRPTQDGNGKISAMAERAARLTTGFTGATISSVCNEAGILSVREGIKQKMGAKSESSSTDSTSTTSTATKLVAGTPLLPVVAASSYSTSASSETCSEISSASPSSAGDERVASSSPLPAAVVPFTSSLPTRLPTITEDYVKRAMEIVSVGNGKRNYRITDDEKEATAFHEAGHAAVSFFHEKSPNPVKLTVLPTDTGALGHMMPGEPRSETRSSRSELEAQICVALGGRVAEELFTDEIGTGASSDLERVTQIATEYVYSYGFGEHLLTFRGTGTPGDYGWSETTKEALEREVKTLVQRCYARTKHILQQEEKQVRNLVHKLIEKETLYAEEISKILASEKKQEDRFARDTP